MTDEEEAILNSITPQLKAAVTWSNSNIANKQTEALRHYKREPLAGDEKLRGKSRWVSPKIQQHVDWLSGQLFRIFDAPESVVEFCGIGPEDEAIAKQQTDVVNWILRTKNSHGAYLQPWIQNGLLTGLGVITAEFDIQTEESLPRILKGVPNEMLVALNEQEEAGQIIIEEVGKAQTIPGPMGPIETRDLKIRTIKRIPRFQILPVAPEDFVVSKDAHFAETGGIAARIQGHRKLVTRGDLLDMGFDKEKVNALPAASDKTDGIALERSKDLAGDQGVGPDDVEVFTIYTRAKLGNDKKTRHWRLTIGGSIDANPVLLDYTEVTKIYPYAAFAPFPIANTLFSTGVADRLLDDHVLITRMYRNVLDNLAEHVNPIKVANPDTVSLDDLLNPHAGKIIRSTDPTAGISFQTTPFVGADAIPVIDQLSQSLEYSTGTGPTMIGVNAEDFQRTSATAANLRSNASQLLIEMISRFFAETGYRALVKIVVDLLIQKPEEAAELISRLTNAEAIPLDDFSTDFDLATSVAFGVMSRDQSQAQLTNLLAQQYQALQAGLPVVNAQGIYSTLSKLVEGQGLKNTAPFLVDPSTLPPAPPPPPPVDPNAGLIQVETAKAELKAQSDEADRQFQMAKARMDDDRLRDQMAQDFELKRAEIEAKYAAQVQIERLKLEQNTPRDPMGTIIQ